MQLDMEFRAVLKAEQVPVVVCRRYFVRAHGPLAHQLHDWVAVAELLDLGPEIIFRRQDDLEAVYRLVAVVLQLDESDRLTDCILIHLEELDGPRRGFLLCGLLLLRGRGWGGGCVHFLSLLVAGSDSVQQSEDSQDDDEGTPETFLALLWRCRRRGSGWPSHWRLTPLWTVLLAQVDDRFHCRAAVRTELPADLKLLTSFSTENRNTFRVLSIIIRHRSAVAGII